MPDISKDVVIGGTLSYSKIDGDTEILGQIDGNALIIHGVDGDADISIETDGSVNLKALIDGQSGIFYTEYIYDADEYEGSYVVIPQIEEQTLQTKNKLLTQNVSIKEIPTYETSNIYGTTFYIGE